MPRFQFGLIADAAQVDANGKLSVLGEFDTIRAKSFPAAHPNLVIVGRWMADPADMGKTEKVQAEVLDGAGKPVTPKTPDMVLRFVPRKPGQLASVGASLILRISGLTLKGVGKYTIRFYVDGKPNGEVDFFAEKV